MKITIEGTSQERLMMLTMMISQGGKFIKDIGPAMLESGEMGFRSVIEIDESHTEVSKEQEEEYMKGHSACGLSIGDRVRVTKSAEDNEGGWANGWADNMSAAVGKVFTIIDDAGKHGFRLKGSGEGKDFLYPHFVLEYVGKDKSYQFGKILKWVLGFVAAGVIASVSYILFAPEDGISTSSFISYGLVASAVIAAIAVVVDKVRIVRG